MDSLSSQPADPRNTSPAAEVPPLDHDSSTLSSNTPFTTFSGAAAPRQPTSNPDAPWFDFGNPSAQSDVLFTNSGTLPSYEPPFQYRMAANEDIKLMILGMASRLDALELAVSTGNLRVGYIQDGVSEILKRPAGEDMVREIGNLKESIRELMKSLVSLFLGGEGVEDSVYLMRGSKQEHE